MLGPHLTAENVADVLGRAKFRTKKELARLVRELHPLPLVPDVIEPLRPELTPARNPTWQQFVSSLTPAVRELPPGERPRDWANDADDVEGVDGADGGSKSGDAVEVVSSESSVPALARVGPVRAELRPITGPQQYQMQFSTSEEHVLLVERAKALLARAAPGKSLGEIHLQVASTWCRSVILRVTNRWRTKTAQASACDWRPSSVGARSNPLLQSCNAGGSLDCDALPQPPSRWWPRHSSKPERLSRSTEVQTALPRARVAV
jgi:hypothetical protein